MRTVVKAMIYCQNELLVITRSGTHPKYPHHMDLPGGVIEPRESRKQGLKRELKEETSIDLDENLLEEVYSKPLDKLRIHLLYKADIGPNKPKINLSWEHEGYLWINENQLLEMAQPKNIDSFFREFLDYLSESHGRSQKDAVH